MPGRRLLEIVTDPELVDIVTKDDSKFSNYYTPAILAKITELFNRKEFNSENYDRISKRMTLFINSYIKEKPENITEEAFNNIEAIANILLLRTSNRLKENSSTLTKNINYKGLLELLNRIFSNPRLQSFPKSAELGTLLNGVGESLKHSAALKKNNNFTDTHFSAYLNALASSANNPHLLIEYNSVLVEQILSLTEVCTRDGIVCNRTATNAKASHVLGVFSAGLRSQNTSDAIQAATRLEEKVLPFLNSFSTDEQNLFNSFATGFFPNQTFPEEVKAECLKKSILPAICERVAPGPIVTSVNETTTLAQTTLVVPNTTTSIPTFNSETTHSFGNETSVLPFDVNNQTSLTSDQTTIDLSLANNYNLAKQLGSGIVVGGIIEIKNELIHKACTVLVNICKEKNYSPRAINCVKGTFWLLNTISSAATAPIVLLYINEIIQDVEKTSDPLAGSELIISTSISFTIAAIFETYHLLANESNCKKIISYSMPILILTGILINPENILIYGGSIIGGVVTKAGIDLVKGRKSLASFFRSAKTTKENDVELQEKLVSTPSTRSTDSNNSNQSSSTIISLPESDLTKMCYFIKPEKLKTIKNELCLLMDHLNNMRSLFQQYIEATESAKRSALHTQDKTYFDGTIDLTNSKLVLINESIKKVQTYQTLLDDGCHHKACIAFTSPEILLKDKSVNGLHALLKEINRILSEVSKNLTQVMGIDQLNEELHNNFSQANCYAISVQGLIDILFSTYNSNAQGINKKTAPADGSAMFQTNRRNTYTGSCTSSNEEEVEFKVALN